MASNEFAYTIENRNWTKSLLEKTKGWLYGFGEGVIRKNMMMQKQIYNPAAVGAAVEYALDFAYSFFLQKATLANYHPEADKEFNLSGMTPLVTKEVFINSFHNDFINNNRFYVEFIRTEPGNGTNNAEQLRNPIPTELNPPGNEKHVLSRKNVKDVKQFEYLDGGTAESIIEETKRNQILLNYMVDSVQFPNYTSKKSTITRFGQDITYINNQHYDPHLTINFTYDMRGNIDRFLHYIAQYSKYYNNTRENKFKIRITSYKSMHDYPDKKETGITTSGTFNRYYAPTYNEFKINAKTFHNIQLDSMQNYSLDNKQTDFISRAIMFTFQGMDESSYDSYGGPDGEMIKELSYDMYNNLYNWSKD